MKTITYFFVSLVLMISSNVFAQHHGSGIGNNSNGKDPAIAALLSIQPLPFAGGNFYTGNWERGIIYTTAELAIFIPAAVLLGRNNWSFGMHNNSSYNYYNDYERSWTNSEMNQFYYLLAGYIVVKIISAFDAGYSAEIYNQNLSVNYEPKNKSALFTLNIPIR